MKRREKRREEKGKPLSKQLSDSELVATREVGIAGSSGLRTSGSFPCFVFLSLPAPVYYLFVAPKMIVLSDYIQVIARNSGPLSS
jgi:hypothetical protein